MGCGASAPQDGPGGARPGSAPELLAPLTPVEPPVRFGPTAQLTDTGIVRELYNTPVVVVDQPDGPQAEVGLPPAATSGVDPGALPDVDISHLQVPPGGQLWPGETAFYLRSQGHWFGKNLYSEGAPDAGTVWSNAGEAMFRVQLGRKQGPQTEKMTGSHLAIYGADGTELCKIVRVFKCTGVGADFRVIDERGRLAGVVKATYGFFGFEKLSIITFSTPTMDWDATLSDHPLVTVDNPTMDYFRPPPSDSGLFFEVQPEKTFETKKGREYYCILFPESGPAVRVAQVSTKEAAFEAAGLRKLDRSEYVSRLAPGMSSLLVLVVNVIVENIIAEHNLASAMLREQDFG